MNAHNIPDPLAGAPLSTTSDAFYTEWAERIEAEDYNGSLADGVALQGDAAMRHSRRLLDSIVGAETLDRITGPGRRSLSGKTGDGLSPKRQVRLSEELDARLTARVEAEHRNRSEIMRDALERYLAS